MDRILLLIVPLAIVLVPASRLLAPLYRWRVRSKIYRWYGALMVIEREMSLADSAERSGQIHARLAEIESAVDAMPAPLAYADQLCALREHIGFVKRRFSPPVPD